MTEVSYVGVGAAVTGVAKALSGEDEDPGAVAVPAQEAVATRARGRTKKAGQKGRSGRRDVIIFDQCITSHKRTSQESLPEPSCDEPKREGLGPIS